MYRKRHKSSHSWVLLIFLLVTGVGGTGCSSGNPADRGFDATLARKFAVRVPEQRTIARDFQLENLIGEIVSLQDYRGKLLLLNFSTSW